MPAEQRRESIIDAALALFARAGFSGTTTKAIAQAAGISEATMFQHFASKEELYVAAFNSRTEETTPTFVARLQEYADRNEDEQLIEAIVRAMLDAFEQDRDMHRMLLYAWLDQDRAENTSPWGRMEHYQLFDFLRSYIARRQAQGVFRPGDPDLLTMILIAFPVHQATRVKLYGIETEHSEDQTAATYAHLFLDGVRLAPRRQPDTPRP
jgi:TetR/AcrR family transcriptional regulator